MIIDRKQIVDRIGERIGVVEAAVPFIADVLAELAKQITNLEAAIGRSSSDSARVRELVEGAVAMDEHLELAETMQHGAISKIFKQKGTFLTVYIQKPRHGNARLFQMISHQQKVKALVHVNRPHAGQRRADGRLARRDGEGIVWPEPTHGPGRATAVRWTSALVEPPIAELTTMAFSNALRVRMSEGFRVSQTISKSSMLPWTMQSTSAMVMPASLSASATASKIISGWFTSSRWLENFDCPQPMMATFLFFFLDIQKLFPKCSKHIHTGNCCGWFT